MLLRHHGPNGPRDVQVDVDDPDATVADLAVALDPSAPAGPLRVDGRRVPASTPLDRAGIGHGSSVGPAPSEAPPPDTGGDRGDGVDDGVGAPAVTVRTVGGLDAGRSWDLPPGTHTIGRRLRHDGLETGAETDPAQAAGPSILAIADPTVSRRHAVLEVADDGTVTVHDVGSTNGTWSGEDHLGDPVPWRRGTDLRCGASTLRHEPWAPPGGRRPPDGPPPWAWHRGPVLPATDDERAPIDPPATPEAPPSASPVGIVAVVGSVAVGAAMVVLLESWLYAAFALLGPVMVLAGALDARLGRRRAQRRGGRRRRADLADLERALADRRADHVASLSAWHPGPAAAAALVPAPEHGSGMPVAPGDELWAVRAGAPDAHRVRLGTGATSWAPPVGGDPRRWPDDVRAVVDRARAVADGPVVCSLRDGPIAIVGPLEARTALARSIVVQAVTAHGPADLGLAGILGAAEADRWSWLAWLPHTQDPVAGSLLASDEDDGWRVATAVSAAHRADAGPGPAPGPDRAPDHVGRRVVLVVVDDALGLGAGRSPARTVLRTSLDAALDGAGSGAGVGAGATVTPVVLVDARADAPAGARVVEVDADGSITGPADLLDGPAIAAGVALDVAAGVARGLGRFVDPDRDDPGRGLPDAVRLAALLGAEALTPAGIAARWEVGGPDPAPTAVVGRSADGPLTLDLAADGPHVLVAGTTGAGKSELLRTLVTSLAVRSSPRDLNLVLIDFKGGSAFDACARLPHTTGIVTDLDEHLASRALRCLDAELRLRERCLRATGSSDLTEHRAALAERPEGGTALARLVVVIDEFATLAAELPDFLDALVGIAQRGRSLGVHLVLATQRPAGAVSDNIRANTALRIALRVQDAGDSVDVVGTPAAADLPRDRPGRAVVRLGPRDIVTVQTAWTGAAAADRDAPVRVRPLRIGPTSAGPAPGERRATGMPPSRPDRAPTELARLVDAVIAAWRLVDGRPARRPWPDPLPTTFRLAVPARSTDPTGTDRPDAAGDGPDQDDVAWGDAAADDLLLGLADDPDHQRHLPYRWRPADGALLLVGPPIAGSTRGLGAAALAAASRWGPGSLHVHVVDLGAGELGPLAGLPHVGAVIGPDERERQRRLVDDLAVDLAARRARPDERRPRRLLVINGIEGLRDRWDDLEPTGTWARLVEVVRRGPEVGIHAALAVDGGAHLPANLRSGCRRCLVLRPADPNEAVAHGVSPSAVADLPPGRGVDPEGPTLVQLGTYGSDLGAAVAEIASRWPEGRLTGAPRPVQVLPHLIVRSALPGPPAGSVGLAATGGTDAGAGPLRLVVGISDLDLGPATLVLAPGGHALVAGPPRSGRTTTLRSLAAAAREADVEVIAIDTGRAGPPAAHPAGVRIAGVDDPDLATLVDTDRRLLLLVDDADLVDPDHPVLARVVRDRRPRRHVVAAARSDRARTAYAHWLRELRADRSGLLLRPDLDLDGELIGARLPRQPSVAPAVGRGWLVGEPEGFTQVATPSL